MRDPGHLNQCAKPKVEGFEKPVRDLMPAVDEPREGNPTGYGVGEPVPRRYFGHSPATPMLGYICRWKLRQQLRGLLLSDIWSVPVMYASIALAKSVGST